MPHLDDCHYQIVHALEKEGWVVVPFPYPIRLKHLPQVARTYAGRR
jgi:hypothetical protein